MSNHNSSDSGIKTLLGIGVGLFAGGALGYYLASEEGKEMRLKAAAKLSELEAEARETLKKQNNVISSQLKTAVESSSEWLDSAKETVQERISTVTSKAEDVADDVEDSYENGVNKAKAKIKAYKETLNGALNGAS